MCYDQLVLRCDIDRSDVRRVNKTNMLCVASLLCEVNGNQILIDRKCKSIVSVDNFGILTLLCRVGCSLKNLRIKKI